MHDEVVQRDFDARFAAILRPVFCLHPPQDGANSRYQYAWTGRFGQIIVRPELKPDNGVNVIAARCQYQYGEQRLCAHFAQYVEAVAIGHHDIQYQQIIWDGQSLIERCVTIVDGINVETLLAEVIDQHVAQLNVIISQKYAHRKSSEIEESWRPDDPFLTWMLPNPGKQIQRFPVSLHKFTLPSPILTLPDLILCLSRGPWGLSDTMKTCLEKTCLEDLANEDHQEHLTAGVRAGKQQHCIGGHASGCFEQFREDWPRMPSPVAFGGRARRGQRRTFPEPDDRASQT